MPFRWYQPEEPEAKESIKAAPLPEELSELDRWRGSVRKSVRSLRTLFKASAAPLPTQTGDGSAIVKPTQASLWKNFNTVIRDIRGLDTQTIGGLLETFKDAAFGRPLNDKHYLMESMVAAAAACPDDFLQRDITERFIKTLWDDLEHPPQTILGEEYKFRQPDGSRNSYLLPHVGKTGMPYARTVQPKTIRQPSMPDPGVLFDALLKRKDPKGTPHPNRISSMLFYLATIIIHDIFRTDPNDYNKSGTSSYLDLAPLYGSTWEEQKKMRTFKDGKIHPDCFSEPRLLSLPPGVGAILIMFNRYHNYVVEQLASINEGGRFTVNPHSPTVDRGYNPKEPEFVDRRDDDLFQTARLITCGLYINIILIDYVRTILNLNLTDDNWQLDPRIDIKDGPPRGTGNQVSAEFNLVYRWHSSISERDDLWTQELFKELDLPEELKRPGVDVSSPENLYKFLGALRKIENEAKSADPWERPFPALKSERMTRQTEGPFAGNYKDADLAALLTASIEDCANAMGPQQVPVVMKAIEVLGITQARTWQCATLNEMREHFKLQRHATFEDVTSNKEVATALKHLYDTPDQIELYPGLIVEDAKEARLPGSGLCPSFTTSRGVLSDAVALVRGDRFYTTAYTPALLTNWGYKEANFDLELDNGCVFYKLFLRALPNSFDPTSVYVHYPLTIPSHMEHALKNLNKDHLYNFDKPKEIHEPVVVFSAAAALEVIDAPETYNVTWGPAMEFLMGPAAKNFMLAGDGPANAKSRTLVEKALYANSTAPSPSRGIPSSNEKWLQSVRAFYEKTTTRLLKEKSYQLAGVSQVDLIRDVGNLAHVHFGAELWGLPLKTADFPHGIFTEQELYMIMSAVFICVFFDLDPPKSAYLRLKAREATQALGALVKAQVELLKATGDVGAWFAGRINPQDPALKQYGAHMLLQLVKAEPDVDKLVWGNIMGTAGGMVANQGQLFSQVLDFYLSGPGREHWPKIQALAKLDTPEAEAELMHYLMEGARLNGETGVFRFATKDVTLTDKNAVFERTYHLKKGDKVMVNLKAAGRDPARFPNPDAVDPTRDLESYMTLGWGRHQCLGLPMTRVALTTMLKVVARLDGLRPAPVSLGRKRTQAAVQKVVKEFVPGDSKVLPESWHYHLFLTEDWDAYFPFPTSKFPFFYLII